MTPRPAACVCVGGGGGGRQGSSLLAAIKGTLKKLKPLYSSPEQQTIKCTNSAGFLC